MSSVDWAEEGKPNARKGLMWCCVHGGALTLGTIAVVFAFVVAWNTGDPVWVDGISHAGYAALVFAGVAQYATHRLQDIVDPGSLKHGLAIKKYGGYVRVQFPMNILFAVFFTLSIAYGQACLPSA